jgi:hypothetical protein
MWWRGNVDRTVRLWELAASTARVLEGHTGWVSALAVLPDGSLASAGNDGTVRMRDLASGRRGCLWQTHRLSVLVWTRQGASLPAVQTARSIGCARGEGWGGCRSGGWAECHCQVSRMSDPVLCKTRTCTACSDANIGQLVCPIPLIDQGVAPALPPAWGARGPEFKSRRSDQLKQQVIFSLSDKRGPESS